MAGIIIDIFVGILILVLAMFAIDKPERKLVIFSKSYKLVMCALFCVFGFLLIYKSTEVPVAYNIDEAGMVYDAINIAEYHVDRYQIRFPVYFNNFGGGQSPFYLYLAASLIKLFGYSIFIVRLPAIFFSLISAVIFVLTIRKEMGPDASVIAMFLFCILPFSIMHSRWGLDAYLFFPMLIISCCVFNYAVQISNVKWFFISGCFFGITLYTYAISYAIIPLFLAVTIIYLLIIGKCDIKRIFAFSVPLFLISVPLLLMLAVNNDLLKEIHTRFFSITKLFDNRISEISFNNIIRNLKYGEYNLFYTLFVDDHLGLNVIPKFGTMYYVSLPVIIYGFVCCLRRSLKNIHKKTWSWNDQMLILFFSALIISMLIGNQSVNKLCALYVPLIYFFVVGFNNIFKKSRLDGILLVGILTINSFLFIKYYFSDFQNDLNKNVLVGSINDLTEALNFADSVNRNDETIYVLDPHQTHILVALVIGIDPVTFNQQKVLSGYDGYVKSIGKYRFQLDAVLPECIYIFRDIEKIPDDPKIFGFDVERFGSYTVYYPSL